MMSTVLMFADIADDVDLSSLRFTVALSSLVFARGRARVEVWVVCGW